MPRGEPPLDEPARHLLEEFTRHRPRQRTDYQKNTRALTILLYWLGAETAVFEHDVHDLARIDVNLATKPACQFLRARGLLVDDPELHRDADEMWLESVLTALPEPVATEVRTWVEVLREQGRREGKPRGYDGIRRYLARLQPVLTHWTATVGASSLRQITRDHVDDAVAELSGMTRRSLATVLRSLFRALKSRRVIFQNPARDLPVGDLTGLPKSIPSDRLMGLLDQARTPLGRLVVALAAIHALPGSEIRTPCTPVASTCPAAPWKYGGACCGTPSTWRSSPTSSPRTGAPTAAGGRPRPIPTSWSARRPRLTRTTRRSTSGFSMESSLMG
ncbi:hypothetical protein [Streptomyces rhizosphaerihabitans]|uniref:hypothetical protein n=1 Tax=Streptomyces rhizosphaerihabitans TaxID=1266770 RepID=UPI0021C09AF3|nr:hypothetical protein [Streptomyces rhizosphaerihabitans]MCT9011529.1 hypothetical protein [Streptomyces rhizosphaerihabitans]